MTRKQECANFLFGIPREGARRDAVRKMGTDARRKGISGTHAQLWETRFLKTFWMYEYIAVIVTINKEKK